MLKINAPTLKVRKFVLTVYNISSSPYLKINKAVDQKLQKLVSNDILWLFRLKPILVYLFVFAFLLQNYFKIICEYMRAS